MTLKEALQRIKELENENVDLKATLEIIHQHQIIDFYEAYAQYMRMKTRIGGLNESLFIS